MQTSPLLSSSSTPIEDKLTIRCDVVQLELCRVDGGGAQSRLFI